MTEGELLSGQPVLLGRNVQATSKGAAEVMCGGMSILHLWATKLTRRARTLRNFEKYFKIISGQATSDRSCYSGAEFDRLELLTRLRCRELTV